MTTTMAELDALLGDILTRLDRILAALDPPGTDKEPEQQGDNP